MRLVETASESAAEVSLGEFEGNADQQLYRPGWRRER